MCIFSEYKDFFGKIDTGIHKYKFLNNTSIFDYLIVILFAMFLTYLTDIPLVLTTIGVLILGIIIHYLFGVETNTIKYLGIKC